MTGVSQGMLEMGVRRGTMATMEKELTVMVRAYLEASAKHSLAVRKLAPPKKPKPK
jgi:hypothetical protein